MPVQLFPNTPEVREALADVPGIEDVGETAEYLELEYPEPDTSGMTALQRCHLDAIMRFDIPGYICCHHHPFVRNHHPFCQGRGGAADSSGRSHPAAGQSQHDIMSGTGY